MHGVTYTMHQWLWQMWLDFHYEQTHPLNRIPFDFPKFKQRSFSLFFWWIPSNSANCVYICLKNWLWPRFAENLFLLMGSTVLRHTLIVNMLLSFTILYVYILHCIAREHLYLHTKIVRHRGTGEYKIEMSLSHSQHRVLFECMQHSCMPHNSHSSIVFCVCDTKLFAVRCFTNCQEHGWRRRRRKIFFKKREKKLAET